MDNSNKFSYLAELEMDTENVVEMEGQQTILKNPISDKMDRWVEFIDQIFIGRQTDKKFMKRKQNIENEAKHSNRGFYRTFCLLRRWLEKGEERFV